MADYTNYCLQNKNEMTALGNAIRSKAGISNTLTVPQMTNAVNSITSGDVLNKPVRMGTTSIWWNVDSKAKELEIYRLTDTGITLEKTTTNFYEAINYNGQIGDIKYTIPRYYAARAIANNGMGTALSTFTTFTNNKCCIKNCMLHGKSNGRGIFVGFDDTGNLDQAYVDLTIYYYPLTGTTVSQEVKCYFQGESQNENGDYIWNFYGELDGYCKITFNYMPSYPLDATGADGTYDAVSLSSVPITMGYTLFESVEIVFLKAGDYKFQSAWGGLNTGNKTLFMSLSSNNNFSSISYYDASGDYCNPTLEEK